MFNIPIIGYCHGRLQLIWLISSWTFTSICSVTMSMSLRLWAPTETSVSTIWSKAFNYEVLDKDSTMSTSVLVEDFHTPLICIISQYFIQPPFKFSSPFPHHSCKLVVVDSSILKIQYNITHHNHKSMLSRQKHLISYISYLISNYVIYIYIAWIWVSMVFPLPKKIIPQKQIGVQ